MFITRYYIKKLVSTVYDIVIAFQKSRSISELGSLDLCLTLLSEVEKLQKSDQLISNRGLTLQNSGFLSEVSKFHPKCLLIYLIKIMMVA